MSEINILCRCERVYEFRPNAHSTVECPCGAEYSIFAYNADLKVQKVR